MNWGFPADGSEKHMSVAVGPSVAKSRERLRREAEGGEKSVTKVRPTLGALDSSLSCGFLIILHLQT